jgi:hypothetical protein
MSFGDMDYLWRRDAENPPEPRECFGCGDELDEDDGDLCAACADEEGDDELPA